MGKPKDQDRGSAVYDQGHLFRFKSNEKRPSNKPQIENRDQFTYARDLLGLNACRTSVNMH